MALLPHHLHEASMLDEAACLACDLRWVEAKTARFSSAVGAVADLDLADTPGAALLRQVLAQAAPLLGPLDPPAALGATLASRLHDIPDLAGVLDGYRANLPRPLLEPAWPPPGRYDPARPATGTGHTGGVINCAFSPQSIRAGWGTDSSDPIVAVTFHANPMYSSLIVISRSEVKRYKHKTDKIKYRRRNRLDPFRGHGIG